MIKISVRDVSSKGIDIDQTFPKESIGLSDEEIDLRSPIHVKAHLERAGDAIVADTKIDADFGFLCARCLEDMHERQDRNYQFNFEMTEGVEFIDVGEEIRQELIIDNPAKVLCKKDCKGMCPNCGINLNIEPCKCK